MSKYEISMGQIVFIVPQKYLLKEIKKKIVHIFAAQKEGISIQLLRRKFWRAQIAQMETFVKFLSALSKPLPSKI